MQNFLCKNCGKVFQYYPSRQRIFCSRDCYYESLGTPLERFMSRINKTDTCWLWQGYTDDKGYGLFWYNDANWLTHRFSYHFLVGPIPKGLYACHNCPIKDNPSCVNPEHLYLGTAQDNSIDAILKGQSPFGDRNGSRTHPESRPRGDAHPTASLTEDKIEKIREFCLTSNLTQQEMAKQLGVAKSTIWRILHHKERVRL